MKYIVTGLVVIVLAVFIGGPAYYVISVSKNTYSVLRAQGYENITAEKDRFEATKNNCFITGVVRGNLVFEQSVKECTKNER